MQSNPHAIAIAALTALGSDLVAMTDSASKLFADSGSNNPLEIVNGSAESAFKRRPRSRGSMGRSASTSSRSTTRTMSSCSCSSTKSLSKATSSKGKHKSKAKSTTSSKASNTKANTIGNETNRRRTTTVLTVAPHPKPEKYVPPPRGTFRTSYTRSLRSDVIGALVSEIENLGMPLSVPLIAADYSELLKELKMLQQEYQNGSSSSTVTANTTTSPTLLSVPSQSPQQELTKRPARPPPVPLTVPLEKLRLEDLPTLSLAEFDFFSASRSRSSDIRETSPVWSRSPAAPAPPRIRRWLKQARIQPVGTLEEVDEQPKSEVSGEGKDE